MANFYSDNPEIKYHLSHPLLKHITDMKERGYADAGKYDYAPSDFDDAMDSYERVLELAGDVCANIIAPNAESVDMEGPRCENGRMIYASKTYENLDATRKAGLNGVTMPRRYGGLNFPMAIYSAINEMVAAGDTGFENIWSLQDCIETLYEFGDEDQRKRFVPRVCEGETMSMDLTEPDAGSDLQSVMLKATFDEENNCWRLNGCKRFITNGDSDIHLVLARSEEGTRDGRGLSMFIYDKRDGGVDVRRIENKLGIHGSPTCELVYKNAKAELCGSRKLGLIKYVMGLMNGARLGIAGQSTGVSQMAYNEALAYAKDRKQFGKAIINFPAVYDMLSIMKAKLDAGRALYYATSRFVDIYKTLEDIERERKENGEKLTSEERAECKAFSRLADAFTPIAKGMTSEYANQNTYDGIQVHGGSGFMLEYACQRLYRDARILTIYEGTTQLQTVAAGRYITNGFYGQVIADLLEKGEQGMSLALAASYSAAAPSEAEWCAPEFAALKERVAKAAEKYNAAVAYTNEQKNDEFKDLVIRHLYEMASDIIMALLLIGDASRCPELFAKSAKVYTRYAAAEIEKHYDFILSAKSEDLEDYRK